MYPGCAVSSAHIVTRSYGLYGYGPCSYGRCSHGLYSYDRCTRAVRYPLRIQLHVVMAYTVMAYIVMAYIVMAHVVMAYIVMAYVVMAAVPGLRRHLRVAISRLLADQHSGCRGPFKTVGLRREQRLVPPQFVILSTCMRVCVCASFRSSLQCRKSRCCAVPCIRVRVVRGLPCTELTENMFAPICTCVRVCVCMCVHSGASVQIPACVRAIRVWSSARMHTCTLCMRRIRALRP